MKNLFALISILFLYININSQSSNDTGNYSWDKIIYSNSIDKSIDSCIELNLKDYDSTTMNPLTKLYNGHFYMKMYENNKSLEDNDRMRNGFPLECFAWLENDTLCVGGSYGFKGGFGFYVKIHDDSFYSWYCPYSDVPLYKLKKSDSLIQLSVDVPALNQKVILTQMPKLKKGEQVKGYLELKSKDFLEYGSEGINVFSVELKVYFDCEISDY